MIQHHNWSLTEIEDMLPYERTLYSELLSQWVFEENAKIEEQVVGKDKLNFTIFFDESEKFVVERINIIGNNITREDVIRNKLILDDETIVYTSGSGGNFIAGLPVGKINHGIESFAVEFFSDLSQLSYVKIQSIKGQN